MATKVPRRVGLRRDTGHPVYLYFKLVERGRNISLSHLPSHKKHISFSR